MSKFATLVSRKQCIQTADIVHDAKSVNVGDGVLMEVASEVLGCWTSALKAGIQGEEFGHDLRIVRMLAPRALKVLREFNPEVSNEQETADLLLQMLAASHIRG
jgi:hypothetical protein